MLRDAKIRTKVILAFGCIILTAAIVIGWLLIEMNGIAKTTQQLYEEPYAASNDMWTVRRNLIDIERVLNKLMSVDESTVVKASESANNTLTKDTEAIQTAVQGLERLFDAPEMSSRLQEIESMLQQGKELRETIINLIMDGKAKEAKTILSDTYEPLFEACNEKVLALFQITEQDAANFVENANNSSRRAIVIGIILLGVGFAGAIIITGGFTRSLVVPLKQLELAADEMSKGNLKVVERVTYTSKDEMGQLADSLRTTMITLSQYVDEISAILLRLAKGDLTVPRDEITDFLGDFSEIKSSFVTILKSFNSTLGEINQASEQVDSGSSQVSDASQTLSQGAAEQASAIEELTARVEEISGQIRENANNAKNANDLTDRVSMEVEESNQKMKQMNNAMEEISNSSQEIGKIIKAIEDIAFQTNILALNAAVEAARAGAAGKGFAVVADEVRNLASKSAEASKSTADLIESSIRAVQNGTNIAEETAHSLETVAQTTKLVVETVDKIAKASEKQATSVEHVTNRVEEISAVVQTNSATAEESAAASEELSSQANLLSQLVARFHLFGVTKNKDMNL